VTYLVLRDYVERIGEALLIQLTDMDGNGAVDQARVDKATAYAEAQFNARVLGRYVPPSSPEVTPSWMKTILLDLAIYDLYKDRSEFDEGVWKVRKAAHDDAIKFLTAVNNGTAVLDLAPVEATALSEVASGTIGWSGCVKADPGWR
jgi:phage gp36-like protein